MRKSNAQNHFDDPSYPEAKKKRVRGISSVPGVKNHPVRRSPKDEDDDQKEPITILLP